MSVFEAAGITRVVDAIIVLVILEMIALEAYRRLRGRGIPLTENAAFLGAGLWMLVAVRVITSGGAFVFFAAAMLISLAFHAMHLHQRWVHRRPEHNS